METAQRRVSPVEWIRQHFWGLLLLAVLVTGSQVAVRWWKRAHPGAMSVIEAQAMDMTVMKPPVGSVPVAAEEVARGPFSAKVTYTGTVAAYMEQNIYPRVEGWLQELVVYNGDQVRPGQLLARLDSPDLATRLSEAAAGEVAAQRDVSVGEAEIARSQAEFAAAQAALAAAESDVEGARAQVTAAERGVRLAASDIDSARAAVAQANKESTSTEADLQYWKTEIKREEALVKTGAISQEEYDSEYAQYVTAQANVESAHAKVEEKEAGVAASQARFDQAEAQVEAARAALRNRREMVSVAGQRVEAARAGLTRSREEVSRRTASANQAAAKTRTASVFNSTYREIRAPFGGMVTKRLIHPGVLVNPAMAILNIVQIDRVRLQANVAEKDLAKIRVGAAVNARPFKNRGDSVIHATVTSVSPLADPVTRTAVVEAVVLNPDHRLLPGDFATMEISTSEAGDALTVPARALVRKDGRDAVWTVVSAAPKGEIVYYCTMHPDVTASEPGKCHKCNMELVPKTSAGGEQARLVPVTVGDTDGERTEILEGLKAGDRVIYAGHTDLKEGDKVFPTEWGIEGPKTMPPPPGGGAAMPGHGDHGGAKTEAQPDTKGHDHPAGVEKATGEKHDHGEVVYTCPMHPEVISDKPGECPKCGMFLEPRK